MTARGYRNNNPLNIRHNADKFQGEIQGADKAFKTFARMCDGFRAGFVIMRSYISRHQCDTIEKIITRWAPPSENDTAAYILFVCTKTGKRPTDPVYFDKTLIPIVCAMAEQENGSPPDVRDAEEGWVNTIARR